MKTIFVKPKDVVRKWYVLDAEGVPLGRVAVKAANLARGKHKACYVPHQEIGDFVIIINAEKAIVTGGKENKKIYLQLLWISRRNESRDLQGCPREEAYLSYGKSCKGNAPARRFRKQAFR